MLQRAVATVLAYHRALHRLASRRPRACGRRPRRGARCLSGLGYYRARRNLHRCAQVVVTEHGGEFPATSAALAELPGIGCSTAAAIAAFCFGERVAILDGNVKRVLRACSPSKAISPRRAAERELWVEATALLPTHDVAIRN